MAAEVKKRFEGKWKAYKIENQEEFLIASGLEWWERLMAKSVYPVFELTVDGDDITTKVKLGGILTTSITFHLDEEYEHKVLMDDIKGVTSYEDGKMKTRIRPNDPKRAEQYVEREIVGDELVVTLTAEGVESKQYFKREET